ncbi:MAG TPA: hypothetical protein VEI97_11040 [bacterium]|nr:hypothetical protein [bacterium]
MVRWLAALVLGALVATGCKSAPLDRFAPGDLEALQAVCVVPPYPDSLDILRNQATGHLKDVLKAVDWIAPEGYLQAVTVGDPEVLRGKGAVVVLSDRNSSTAAGVLLLLFEPNGPQDVFNVPLMIEGGSDGHPSTWVAPPTPKLRYPFNWLRPDGDLDHVGDHLLYISNETKAHLVGPDGLPRYDFRWGGP